MTDVVMSFRFHPAFRIPARLFGVRPETAVVELDDDHLTARFGPWRVQTELENIAAARVTTGYAWPKVIGPPHVSLADRGLTFATNPDMGVCIEFEEPVTGLDPLGLVRHPTLTVTVDDAPALAELLDRSSHDETRTHTPEHDVTTDDLLQEANDDLEALTAAELRQRARERGLTGVSRLSKAELVRELSPKAPAG
jgi:hypothetical protein